MKLRPIAPALALGLAALAGPSPAHAQGFFGGFAMPWVPTPTDSVNAWALQNAARGGQRPPSNNVYANNPNSYVNRIRDNGLVQQQDVRGPSVGSRRAAAMASRSLGDAPRPAARPDAPPQPAAAPAVTSAALSLASFFDAAGALIWPAGSPDAGPLKAKRDTSDRAVAAVRDQVAAHGHSPISLAAEARQKLLDYGRPALQEIRTSSTAPVADAFHEFLRSLYDALAASTIPPAPAQ